MIILVAIGGLQYNTTLGAQIIADITGIDEYAGDKGGLSPAPWPPGRCNVSRATDLNSNYC
jgi:hypothetical protein